MHYNYFWGKRLFLKKNTNKFHINHLISYVIEIKSNIASHHL